MKKQTPEQDLLSKYEKAITLLSIFEAALKDGDVFISILLLYICIIPYFTVLKA